MILTLWIVRKVTVVTGIVPKVGSFPVATDREFTCQKDAKKMKQPFG